MTELTRPIPQDRSERVRVHAIVRGLVQGVGFRPFVFRRANELALGGHIANAPGGVVLELEGPFGRIAGLLEDLKRNPPANAVVTAIESRKVDLRGDNTFVIEASRQAGQRSAGVLPDLAICPDCLVELFDENDRRYRYPFVNCTQCGPRYSIIEDLPYDRVRTSMRHFPMCADCRAEYEDPSNRRFHAEPNACPKCGPRLSLWGPSGETIAREDDALRQTVEALRCGAIVAVKGVGGFHLMTDARDGAAVRRLRERKRRSEKPFAVMFPSLCDIAAACAVEGEAQTLLTSPARPIVLLPRRGSLLSQDVAPGNPWIGALLPYAPLHYLLMSDLGFPVVATSGNASGEPIVTDEHEALRRLSGIADFYLVHDRPIVRAIDDSVARIVCGRGSVLRLARGYAPAAFASPGASSGIVALGGHLKANVALSRGEELVVGQHVGDLETVEARVVHTGTIDDLTRLYGTDTRVLVRDLHPDYATSRFAEERDVPKLRVQHHVAHVAACMAEHGLAPPVLGVAFDGTGYGPDGTIWGGEFLYLTETGWQRVAHFRQFCLPGGESAVAEPRRAALGLLYEAFGVSAFEMTDLPPVADFSQAERNILCAMLERGINAPRTSSMGRLFDAFAALCGLRQRASYEGQAAIELEGAAETEATCAYGFSLRRAADASGPYVVDWQPALEEALSDIEKGLGPALVSAAFHRGLADSIVAVAEKIGERRVALTGGCFQNALLTETAVSALRAAAFEPVWHRRIPTNDGGIAFGQAAWAISRKETGQTPCV